MSDQKNIKPIQVFAGEFWQASLVKQLLEDNNIPAFMENEHMGSIAPWRIEPGGFNPFKVIISNEQYDLAVKLIEEFDSAPDEQDANSGVE